MMPEFWKSAGLHLTQTDANGWLTVTPDYLRAYFTRPEVHPLEESCDNEHALFEALMSDPFRPVSEAEIEAMADPDARDNYRVILRFRDLLADAGTIERAYLNVARSERIDIPPVFIDQMVHLILASILRDVEDPLRIRAAELFFRDQNVSLDDGRVMLADDEIVEMYSLNGGLGGLGQLLMDANTPARQVTLDVLDDDNKDIYWARSDRFDTVIDFRFTQPALDAFARVLEAWIKHFFGLSARAQPMQSIKDERWSWHVGLDAEATRILNALYEGRDVGIDALANIVALFRLEFRDRGVMLETMRGKPIYLGLAKTSGNKLKMKPHNLLTNLPLRTGG